VTCLFANGFAVYAMGREKVYLVQAAEPKQKRIANSE
jgi:hypothetical protein